MDGHRRGPSGSAWIVTLGLACQCRGQRIIIMIGRPLSGDCDSRDTASVRQCHCGRGNAPGPVTRAPGPPDS